MKDSQPLAALEQSKALQDAAKEAEAEAELDGAGMDEYLEELRQSASQRRSATAEVLKAHGQKKDDAESDEANEDDDCEEGEEEEECEEDEEDEDEEVEEHSESDEQEEAQQANDEKENEEQEEDHEESAGESDDSDGEDDDEDTQSENEESESQEDNESEDGEDKSAEKVKALEKAIEDTRTTSKSIQRNSSSVGNGCLWLFFFLSLSTLFSFCL